TVRLPRSPGLRTVAMIQLAGELSHLLREAREIHQWGEVPLLELRDVPIDLFLHATQIHGVTRGVGSLRKAGNLVALVTFRAARAADRPGDAEATLHVRGATTRLPGAFGNSTFRSGPRVTGPRLSF